MTDGEVWNQGVDFYRAGDVTNALRVLKPLMLTREFGAHEILSGEGSRFTDADGDDRSALADAGVGWVSYESGRARCGTC